MTQGSLNMESVLKVAAAIIAAFGSSAVILVACSSWLGKVWASRILERDRAKYARELQALRGEASEQLAHLTARLDTLKRTEPPIEGAEALERFYKSRLQLYGYLGMLAPQAVMDAQDEMMEFLLDVIEGKRTGDWGEMRVRALRLLNEIRQDVAVDKSPIEYRGAR